MKKKIKNIFKNLILLIKEEYKFFLFCICLVLFMLFPLDYYILMSGGIRDINESVIIEKSYKGKGSYNISYVSQLDATPATLLLSYIIPTWEREKISDYKIDDNDTIKDINFRDTLDLEVSNNNAKYWGYTLAGEKIQSTNKKFYIIYSFKEYDNNLKVQDEMISINGEKINDLKHMSNIIDSYNEGDILKIKVKRNNKEIEVDSKVYIEKGKKVIGIVIQSFTNYKTDKKIEFKFKDNEKGPSGGLITALEVFDKLTKKDYTHGLKIAGTGTIEEDGSIGAIGGIKYKVRGAAKKKVDLYFVPKDNYKECMKTVKEDNLDIKVVKVSNIKDAVKYLKKLGDD